MQIKESNNLIELSHISLPYCEVFMRPDQILQFHLAPNTDVYLQHVQEMVNAGVSITNNVQHPVIFFIGEFSTFNKDAREFTADPNKETMSTAIAYVTTNLANRLIVNFFMTFNKPVKPIKMFTNEESALKWLANYPSKI